jgi:hypothetical protein
VDEAAPRPAHRALHGLEGLLLARRILQALVERHHDIDAQERLDRDRALGRQLVRRPVQVRAERHAALLDLAQVREREHLEAARVRQHGAIPRHERVHAAQVPHSLCARAQHQVIRVREDDRADLLPGRPAPASTVASRRPRHQRFDRTVAGQQRAGTNAAPDRSRPGGSGRYFAGQQSGWGSIGSGMALMAASTIGRALNIGHGIVLCTCRVRSTRQLPAPRTVQTRVPPHRGDIALWRFVRERFRYPGVPAIIACSFPLRHLPSKVAVQTFRAVLDACGDLFRPFSQAARYLAFGRSPAPKVSPQTIGRINGRLGRMPPVP